MGTKNKPGKYDCYQAAKPDEPMFTLLARDPLAPVLVLLWATLREQAIDAGAKPESDRAKAEEARQCAQAMSDWRRRESEESA